MECGIAIIQINATVGALERNLERVIRFLNQARQQGASLAVLPELVLTGYPPEDLLHKPAFLQRLARVEAGLAEAVEGLGMEVIYGSVRHSARGLVNAAVHRRGATETGYFAKHCLPNYGVFDEQRYFVPGEEAVCFTCCGLRVGVSVCEDLWADNSPIPQLVRNGAELLININASPYHVGKAREREEVARGHVLRHGLPLLYGNLVGGQDELVFDGGSFALDATGGVAGRCGACVEQILLLRAVRDAEGRVRLGHGPVAAIPDVEREIYRVLCLGLADYVAKNGFEGVVLGLSGGIDSALTAVICADALGAERVETVMMPSPYTSRESLEDAADLAARLGVRLISLDIEPMFAAFRKQLATEFAGLAEDVTEENLQPRIRATLLMALCNKKGRLLVTTGNKSEMSVGYATLYGDMAGGFSVLKDLLKEWVFRLSRARNRWAEEAGEAPPIPERVLEKPPTAELRPNQKDSDSLPPYPVLDPILEMYVERECGIEEMVARGFDRETVLRVVRLVDRNEYKRRQAPPGVKVTQRGFGKDRRYPITNGFTFS
ncbi:MAG: NAD+ synthase [Magnetococcales bacterium]|nr:NAD+ synthase [Magnetococcales bacterium]